MVNYPNAYSRLVAELGEAGAKEVMRARRAKNTDNKGGGFRDPKFAKEMAKRRWANSKKIGGSASG